MHHFDIHRLDLSVLNRVLQSSFPDLSYEIVNDKLTFAVLTPSEKQDIETLIFALKSSFTQSDPISGNAYFFREQNKSLKYSEDIHTELERCGDLVWLGEGLALLSGKFLEVKRSLEYYWLEYAARELGAKELENPAFWSPKVANLSEYLSDFPHEATFLLGAKRDSRSISSVSKAMAKDANFWNDLDTSSVSDSISLLGFGQPSVCTSCYYALGQRSQLTDDFYTTYNRVFRNEGTTRLDRLLSFSVRDIIAVGSDEFVRRARERFLAKSKEFIEILNLEAEITNATDPFFANKASKIFFQKTANLKHEIRVTIPYDKQSIAVGSVNLHLQTFGARFSMKTDSGVASSACFGIGFERLTYALFSQNGPDYTKWDKSILSILGLR
jgi:hypothetical protein